MNPLSLSETRHFESVGIDPKDVGDVIGKGSQYVARDFLKDPEEPSVVKTALWQLGGIKNRLIGCINGPTYDVARRECDLCANHFEPYTVQTDFQSDGKGDRFCMIQERVQMERLTPEILKTRRDVRDQLADILQRNTKLERDQKLSFDAMGWNLKKFFRLLVHGEPYIDNIGVDMEEALKIFDYGLLPLTDHPKLQNNMFKRIHFGLVGKFQESNLRKFGVDIE